MSNPNEPAVPPAAGWPPFPGGAAVVVTGAASGIGRATSKLAAALGLRVALWDIDVAGLVEIANELTADGADVITAKVDVTDADQIAAAFIAAGSAFTHIDYLVNNAGPASQVARPFADGLMAGVGSVERVTNQWCELGRRDGDAVVNVASIAGTMVGGGGQAWYPATKGAIAGYTRFLAVERPGGIRANAVAPGMVATPRLAAFIESDLGRTVTAKNPLGRAGEAHEIANAIIFLLSPAASYVNGAVLVVDGGSTVGG